MTTMVEDPYVTCPFDEGHRIIKSRMQFHLVKCKENHPLFESQGKVVCPYNALHIVNSSEIMHHTRNCEDGTTLIIQELSTANKCFSGTISIEESNYQLAQSLPISTDWDNDDYGAGYDPTLKAHEKLIPRVKIRASKAKKKQFRLHEHKRIAHLEALTGKKMYQNDDSEDSMPPINIRKPVTRAF